MSTAEMVQCAVEDLDALEAELEVTLFALINLSPDQADPIRGVQEDWRTYRDRDCDVAASIWEGGSLQPLMHGSCLASHTNDRIDALLVLDPQPRQRLRHFAADDESTSGEQLTATGSVTGAEPTGTEADRIVGVKQVESIIDLTFPDEWGPARGTIRQRLELTYDDSSSVILDEDSTLIGLYEFGFLEDRAAIFTGRFEGTSTLDGSDPEPTSGYWYATRAPGSDQIEGVMISSVDPEINRSEFTLTV